VTAGPFEDELPGFAPESRRLEESFIAGVEEGLGEAGPVDLPAPLGDASLSREAGEVGLAPESERFEEPVELGCCFVCFVDCFSRVLVWLPANGPASEARLAGLVGVDPLFDRFEEDEESPVFRLGVFLWCFFTRTCVAVESGLSDWAKDESASNELSVTAARKESFVMLWGV
jgi:hypothetical protein